jgi:hypothetical protein
MYAFDKFMLLDAIVDHYLPKEEDEIRTILKKHSVLHFTNPVQLRMLKSKESAWVMMSLALIKDTEVNLNRTKAEILGKQLSLPKPPTDNEIKFALEGDSNQEEQDLDDFKKEGLEEEDSEVPDEEMKDEETKVEVKKSDKQPS